MKTSQLASLSAVLCLAALGACSKPASQAASDTTAAAANVTSDASNGGGAVSPPQANGAVNADANKTSTDVAAASNSFTQDQAKGHLENAGYTDVANLTKTPDGLWTGTAKKDGKSVNVAVDFKGAITAN